MSKMFIIGGMFSWVLDAFYALLLAIDNIVYQVINWIYQVFFLVTEANLFDTNGAMADITERIYVVLGVVMLFVFAYNIIILITNPDKLSKGNSLTKIVKDTVISLVLIAFLPTLFNLFYTVQHRVLETNIIGNVILGGSSDNVEDGTDIKSAGVKVATTIFSTFYHPMIIDDSGNERDLSPMDCENNPSEGLCETYNSALKNAVTFRKPSIFITNPTLKNGIEDGKMRYLYIISTLCGALAAYLFASFTLDVGIRAVKLGVLQLVAPVPIMLRITKPSGGIFSKWLKEIKDTYISLFVRLAIIYFAMFTINLIWSRHDWFSITDQYDGILPLIAELVLILSVLAFAKEAPNLLKNIVGGVGGVEWNIKKKLNSDTYEYGRRAATGLGTVGSNLGRDVFNTLFKRNPDGMYGLRNPRGMGKEFWRNARNLPNSIVGGAYRGWKSGGGSIDKIGDQVRQASAETRNSIDRHENTRERRINRHPVLGKFPIVGSVINGAQDIKEKYEAAGGLSTYIGNKLNYTTSNRTANMAAELEKSFDSLTSYATKGVADIKEDYKKEASEVRKKYRDESIKLDEKESLLKTRADYAAYNTSLQQINNRRTQIQNSADYSSYHEEEKKIKLDVKKFNETYNTKLNALNSLKTNLQDKRNNILANTTLSATERAEALRNVDDQIATNNTKIADLNTEKTTFDASITSRNATLAATEIGRKLAQVDADNAALHASGIGAEFKKINDDRERAGQIRDNSLKSIKGREKAEIRNKVQENLNNPTYRDDITRFFKNNSSTIRENFALLPIDAQKRVLENAGINTKTPGFNTEVAIEDLLRVCQSDMDFSSEDTGKLIGFMDGLKQEQKAGPGNIHMSRLTDAINKANNSGGNK